MMRDLRATFHASAFPREFFFLLTLINQASVAHTRLSCLAIDCARKIYARSDFLAVVAFLTLLGFNPDRSPLQAMR